MRRTLLILVGTANLALWLCVVVGWGLLLWFEHWWGCPGLTGSVADRQHWGWFPPGQVCEYDLPGGGTHVDAPSTARLLVAALLVVWPASTVAFLAIGLALARESVDRHDGPRPATSTKQ